MKGANGRKSILMRNDLFHANDNYYDDLTKRIEQFIMLHNEIYLYIIQGDYSDL